LARDDHSSVERSVVAVLRPLIKLALRLGVAHGRFSDLAKEAYVDVSRDHFSGPGRKATASRIAILTGLTRRDVARLLKEENAGEQASPRTRFNRAARVLGAWSEDPKYLDGRGAPASLPFESEDGVSFMDLVRDHGADVTPRAVLEELLRVGSVKQLKNGRYRALQRFYVPESDDEKLAILGTDVADLISTIDHNLDPETGSPYFQRKVSYDNLPEDYLPKLRKLVEREAQRLLERLDRDMSKHDRDVKPSKKGERPNGERHRAMLGIYFHQDENDEAE
jgi:hypothetical protein